jgi:site-specific DNA-methyltransferase (adenine-specific)
MQRLILGDNNKELVKIFAEGIKAQIIFADCIYESEDFDWAFICQSLLKDTGVFILMTDYHTSAEWKCHLDFLFGKERFLNWLIFKNEFGNFKKDRFRQCHDDVLIYTKSKNYKWYPERIQVEKVTAKCKGLNKSGRQTKLATSVITDICLTTISKERVKDSTGIKNLKWQKPIKLIDRLLQPFSDEGDLIIDPFMGSNTTGAWCIKNSRDYIGIENNPEVFEIAKKRLEN